MCAALAALLLCSLTACGKTEEPERQDIFAMDTYMSLAAYGDGAREALAAAAREINRLEQELSRTVSASDIYKLNDSGSAVVSEETAALRDGRPVRCDGGAPGVPVGHHHGQSPGPIPK